MTPTAILANALEAIGSNQLALVAVANKAGLLIARVRKAAKGYPIGASDHLRICAAIKIDPDTGNDIECVPPPGDFEFKALGAGVAMRRIQLGHDKSIRNTALAIGVVHSTFLKIERGEVTSIASVLKACRYVGLSPYAYVKHPEWSSDRFTETLTRPPANAASEKSESAA
jgi:hypothetical protein